MRKMAGIFFVMCFVSIFTVSLSFAAPSCCQPGASGAAHAPQKAFNAPQVRIQPNNATASCCSPAANNAVPAHGCCCGGVNQTRRLNNNPEPQVPSCCQAGRGTKPPAGISTALPDKQQNPAVSQWKNPAFLGAGTIAAPAFDLKQIVRPAKLFQGSLW
jgi:hypothetical protein